MKASPLVTLVVVAAMFLAGCTAPAKPFDLDSVVEYIDRSKPYTWPSPVVTDAQGEILAGHELGSDPRVGRFVHRMVSKEGANPGIGFTERSGFLSGFEKVHRSRDGGQNWTNVTNYRTDNFPEREDRWYNLASSLAVDEATQRIFVLHWTVGIPTPLGRVSYCPGLFWSQDDGDKWVPTMANMPNMGHSPESCVSPESSYGLGQLPSLVTSAYSTTPPLGSVPPLTPAKWDRVVHVCWAVILNGGLNFEPHNTLYCSASFDSGASWERTTVVAETLVEDALEACYTWSVGRGASTREGHVAFPVLRLSRNGPCAPGVITSKDNGLTWEYSVGPSGNQGTNMDITPQIAIGDDGTAYLVYRNGNNFAPYYYWSDRLFEEGSWKGPYRIAPVSQEINSHISILAGEAGRIAVAYYGTLDVQDRSILRRVPPWGADANSVWNVYVTQSFNAKDGAPLFVTIQVNPSQDPVQIGCLGVQQLVADAITADGGCGVTMSNHLSLGKDKDGRIYLAFTDACDPRNDCIHDFSSGFQARDRNLAVAAQQGGRSITGQPLEAWNWMPPYVPPKHSMADVD